MTDGGVADAIPVMEAIHRGARRIMVIRSRHWDYQKRLGFSDYFMSWYLRRCTSLKQAMAKRVQRYIETVALIRKPPDGIAIVEICPPQNFRVSRLSQDRLILQEGYDQGRALAGETIARWYAT
jgi:predicted patatin/cPLA2 family phospholipase